MEAVVVVLVVVMVKDMTEEEVSLMEEEAR